MESPPEFLRLIADGAFDSVFVVLSNGFIWHMNEPSHRMFRVVTNDRCDTAPAAYVSNYLCFNSPREQGQHSSVISWNKIVDGELATNKKWTATGIGTRNDGTLFPLTINFVKIARTEEGLNVYDRNGRRHESNDWYYILYMKNDNDGEAPALQVNSNLGVRNSDCDALIVLNEQGIIQHSNVISTRILGWSQDEFIGKHFSMIIPSFVATNNNNLENEIGCHKITTARRKDASTFPCILGTSLIENSRLISCCIRDIPAENTEQSTMIQNNNYMHVILDASFDALFVISDHGIILMINNASVKVFGWTKEELIGQNINIIMPPKYAQKHDSYLENYARTGIKKMIGTQREVEALRKDGTLFSCILGLSELRTRDGEVQYVGFIRDVTLQKSLLIAEAEREASDNLLHNILPQHIAQRLKQDPTNIADHFDNTTILFADIVGFTDRTSTMSPREIVIILNDLFSLFDALVETYDLNKVKTIGDCYMVTSIPSSDLEHDGCARVCHFALDLIKAVRTYNHSTSQHDQIELRVGIAIGQVVAGVLGSKRYLFDMWGDAVNTAARMEQHGLPGQIQVTKEVVHSAGKEFHFECRGKLAVKGKGVMETYILKRAKDAEKRYSMFQSTTAINTPAMRSYSDSGVFENQYND